MASFTPGGGNTTPFGRNEFLRSVRDVKDDSFTLSAASVPSKTIDGVAGQKILQPGTVLAKITSGAEIGKVGPFQAGALDGRADLLNIVGICKTFLPWTLVERDVEVAVVYEATVVQAWCKELNAAGAEIVLTNATAAGMVGKTTMSIIFRS